MRNSDYMEGEKGPAISSLSTLLAQSMHVSEDIKNTSSQLSFQLNITNLQLSSWALPGSSLALSTDPQNCEILSNVCCFKSLNLGEVHYATIYNWISVKYLKEVKYQSSFRLSRNLFEWIQFNWRIWSFETEVSKLKPLNQYSIPSFSPHENTSSEVWNEWLNPV